MITRTPTIEGATLFVKENELKQKKSDNRNRNQFPHYVHCGETNQNKGYYFKVIDYQSDWPKLRNKSGKQTKSDQPIASEN